MCGTKEKEKYLFLILCPPLLALAVKFGQSGLGNPGATLRGVRMTLASLGSSTLSKKSWRSTMFSTEWFSWYSPIREYGFEESEKRSGKQVALAIANTAFHSTVLGAPEPGRRSKPPSECTIHSQCGRESRQSRWVAWLQTNKQTDKPDPNIQQIKSYKLQNLRLTSTKTIVTIFFCSLQKQARAQALKEHW